MTGPPVRYVHRVRLCAAFAADGLRVSAQPPPASPTAARPATPAMSVRLLTLGSWFWAWGVGAGGEVAVGGGAGSGGGMGAAAYLAMSSATGPGQNEVAAPPCTYGWHAPSTPASVARWPSSLARQAAASSRSAADGIASSTGCSYIILNRTDGASPSPNGTTPHAAKQITEPSENTSLAGLAGWPATCSGDMYDGEPSA